MKAVIRLCAVLLVFLPNRQLFGQDERVSAILENFSGDSLRTEIRRLSGELPVNIGGTGYTIPSRLYNQPGNNYAFQYLRQKLEGYGMTISTQSFSANGRNLFGIKYGSVYPEKVCMIGAHYDDLPTGSIAPGADDNASGCAAVLEAARLMAETDFPCTVIFAFWDEEELGLIGSSAYVENGMHGQTLMGYINLDMIGWDGNGDKLTEIHTRPAGNSLRLSQMVVDCNTFYNIGLSLEIVNPGSVNTDHFPFWQAGYSAVGINEEYAGDVNPHYHSVSDQLQYLDPSYMDANARLAIASLSTLAFSNTVSTNPAETASGATIFPNPAGDVLNVRFPEIIPGTIEVSLNDQRGKVVVKTQLTDQYFTKFTLEGLAAGSYLLTVKGSDFSYSFPVVKH